MSLQLLHSPAHVLQQLLVALGVGTDPTLSLAWPVTNDSEPSTPDNVVTTYDTTPHLDGSSMLDGEQWIHHGVQVRVRGIDKPTAYQQAELVRWTLAEGVRENTVHVGASTYVVHACCGMSLVRMGKEVGVSKRNLYTVNLTMSLTRIS